MKSKIRWELVFMVLVVGIFSVLVAHLINFSSNSLTGFAIAGMTEGPIGNASFLNCTVVPGNCSDIPNIYNFTQILKLYNYTNSHAGLANTTGFNYSLCCAPTVSGVMLNWTNSSADNSTYFNFLNLFQMNNSHVALPNATFMHYANGSNLTIEDPDPYEVSAMISTSVGTITCNYYENYYGNCSLETETCLLTVPFNMTANYTNLHVADCNYSSAYDTSICCELTPILAKIYINGTYAPPGSNFSYAGKPTEVTVESPLSSGQIIAYEYNGYTFSSIPQYTDANVSTTGIAQTPIIDLNTSFTLIPTGGPTGKEDKLGEYGIRIIVQDSGGSTIYTQDFNVTHRDLLNPGGSIDVPSESNVAYNLQNLYSTFTYVQDWLNSGGGVNRHLLINGSYNVVGNDFTIRAAEPTGLNIQVHDNNTELPINATIELIENNGFMLFALSQYTDSNVTNIVTGTVNTTDSGVANVTLIQTGGLEGKEDYIGNFSVQLKIYNTSNHLINTVNLTVDRTLTAVSGSPESVPSQSNVAYNLQNMYSTFTYVQAWLNQ